MSNDNSRIVKLEEDVYQLNIAMTNIAADFRFIREKIENYLKTHDKVITIENEIRNIKEKIKKIESSQESIYKRLYEVDKKANSSLIKIATIAGTLYAITSILPKFL